MKTLLRAVAHRLLPSAVVDRPKRGFNPPMGVWLKGELRDALAGLTNLGYDETRSRSVLEKVLEAEPDLDVSEALRAALKHFAKAGS